MREFDEETGRRVSLRADPSGPSVTGARSLGANHSLNVLPCTCRTASFIAFISLLSSGTRFVATVHPAALHPGRTLLRRTDRRRLHTYNAFIVLHSPHGPRHPHPANLTHPPVSRILFVFVFVTLAPSPPSYLCRVPHARGVASRRSRKTLDTRFPGLFEYSSIATKQQVRSNGKEHCARFLTLARFENRYSLE